MAGKHIGRMEFVEEKPILFRTSSYDVGEGGQRTLVNQHTFLEYRVLPEGAVVPTIDGAAADASGRPGGVP